MKFFILLFSLIIFFAGDNTATAQSDPACVTNPAGEIIVGAGSPQRCRTSPDQYKMTVYEIGLCKGSVIDYPTSQPKTKLVAPDCYTIFTSELGGSPIVITGTSSTSLQGNFTLPPEPGEFTHAYLVLENTAGISGTWTFKSVDSSIIEFGVYDSSGNFGNVCWTVGSPDPITNKYKEVYFSRNSLFPYATKTPAKLITKCGLVAESPGIELITFESLDSDGDRFYQPAYENIFSDGRSTIAGIYLLDANGDVATSSDLAAANSTRSILYFTTINPSGSLIIDENTRSLNLEINNSIGAEINFYNPSGGDNLTVNDPIIFNFGIIAGFSLRFSKN